MLRQRDDSDNGIRCCGPAVAKAMAGKKEMILTE